MRKKQIQILQGQLQLGDNSGLEFSGLELSGFELGGLEFRGPT